MGIIETINMLTREEGFEQGENKKSYEVVSNMLKSDKFTTSEISNFVSVDEDFVVRVQRDLNK